MSQQSRIVLPEDAYDHLLCMYCGNYLSIGPIMVSSEEEVVCGRCLKPNKSVSSLFNVVAAQCTFNCVNHFAGCQQLVHFGDEAMKHETTCRYKKNFDCPVCFFVGNSCQLMYHLRKLHVNSFTSADTLAQVLSYNDVSSYANSIASMTSDELKLLIYKAARIFSFCCNCKKLLGRGQCVYICTKYHFVCSSCFQQSCPMCHSLPLWDNNTELHRILLECEWPDCTERMNIFNYLLHKAKCQFRQYKCPKKECQFSGNLASLRKHWHLNYLQGLQTTIHLEKDCVYYWITHFNDILFVGCKQLYYETVENFKISVANVDVILDVYNKLVASYTSIVQKKSNPYHDQKTIKKWNSKVLEPVKFLFVANTSTKFSISYW